MEATRRYELNGDQIGYLESYDFSRANISYEARVDAITTIASVCYMNPKAIGSTKLYDRLAMENKGLPSSSYEFVPVLLYGETMVDVLESVWDSAQVPHTLRFGETIMEDGKTYLLTNLRALIHDVGEDAGSDKYYNTSEESIAIIKRNFKVYKSVIDLSTARQFMRHRASWQELSRRYVSGDRAPFQFYVSNKMAGITSSHTFGMCVLDTSTEQLLEMCRVHYDTAIANKIKPEEARRIIPQAMYTTVWSAWLPKQLDVLFKLRLDNHAQQEIQWLTGGIKELL
jgi:thymidylate synthase (FAD)